MPRPAGPVWAVVVAAGSGRRFGGPKQFSPLGGRLVVEWSVTAARSTADGVVVVVPDGGALDLPRSLGADLVVPGGPTRSASVSHGLSAIPTDAAVVVVHDAVRPLARAALFEAVVAALDDGVAGALCGVPVVDTVKRVARTADLVTVVDTLDRAELVAVQTPQAFRSDILRQAHSAGGEATDDAALVEALGGTVRVVPGDPTNLKVTTPADLAYAELLLAGSGGA
ncbi:MAG: 2-C-methyl-D-erythritol 4-phosphate cytidylyltransferase [Acidimicrobiales bacterium]